MAISLFRLVGAIGRTYVASNILSGVVYQLVFVLGGFVVSKGETSSFTS